MSTSPLVVSDPAQIRCGFQVRRYRRRTVFKLSKLEHKKTRAPGATELEPATRIALKRKGSLAA